jgi:acetyl esterase/lipase
VPDPEYLNPFVLPIQTRAAERHGPLDLYLPDTPPPRPAILFVHGGPIPADLRPTPRNWPVYQAYASLAAARGAVGVTVDHRLHDLAGYPVAAHDVAAAVQTVRADPRVNPDQIAIWFFSGGGLLLADWLRTPPPWLRCVAASYPVLAPLPGQDVDPRFKPTDAVATAGTLPIVLTRVGRERPPIAATVDAFVTAAHTAGASLTVIDVPNGRHGFDILDHTDESRRAITQAIDTVLNTLT